jgi:hypothetical protein
LCTIIISPFQSRKKVRFLISAQGLRALGSPPGDPSPGSGLLALSPGNARGQGPKGQNGPPAASPRAA